jgi:hypothetical protein
MATLKDSSAALVAPMTTVKMSKLKKSFVHHSAAGSPEYTYIGCFKEEAQNSPYGNGLWALPVSLTSSAGWTVDQCAVAARDKGYPVFALQGYGLCFMGAVADVAKMIAASKKTTDNACSALPCAQAGTSCPPSLNKVYFIGGNAMFPSLLPIST